MKNITGKELGALLFNIHNHDENNEKIIYYEEDLLPILEYLGLPKPEWNESTNLEELKKLHESLWNTYGSELCVEDMIRKEDNIKNNGMEN